MSYTCTILTPYSEKTMRSLFSTELERSYARSDISITQERRNAAFKITAQDITALRAAVNSVTSILSTYEKTLEATR
ncbi:hypothetical protein GOV11_01470 [Candidatus Woesearchaeota archaeon]|nr:hypothetical protein [Candidatus Woesearchaeota archaeon]